MFDARAFITEITQKGITLSLTDRGTLRYQGDESAVSFYLPEIRRRKPALLWQLRHMGKEVTP